jgi:hypothetical protein
MGFASDEAEVFLLYTMTCMALEERREINAGLAGLCASFPLSLSGLPGSILQIVRQLMVADNSASLRYNSVCVPRRSRCLIAAVQFVERSQPQRSVRHEVASSIRSIQQ